MLYLKRFAALYIDLAIVSALTIVPGVSFELPRPIIVIAAYILLCFRDISGRSVGKRILKLSIVNYSTNDRFSKTIGLIIRNVTVIIWPVEALIAYLNKGRRLGDIFVGSLVK